MRPNLDELALLAAVDRSDPHHCDHAPRCAACKGCYACCGHVLAQTTTTRRLSTPRRKTAGPHGLRRLSPAEER